MDKHTALSAVHPNTWTPDAVAARFEEAAKTAHMLPSGRLQGYVNVWSRIVRERQGSSDEKSRYRAPPTPEATARMQEAMQWVQCLEVDERHLVWMRASKERWRTVATRLGVCIKTAQRRHEKALAHVAAMLNGSKQTQPMSTTNGSRPTGLRPSIFER